MTRNGYTFADELRDLINDGSTSINRLSQETGISRSTLTAWLKNRNTSTSSHNLHLLAKALGKEIRVVEPV